MAYSSGFNPHPRISYAGAAPTGAASEAEYLEIGLAAETDPGDVRARLDEALPPGLDVLEVVPSAGGSLADLLRGQPLADHACPASAPRRPQRAVAAFLAADEVLVERMTKKGLRTFDCRAAVVVADAGRVGARRRGGVCDTRSGLAARNPVRETRRRPRRSPRGLGTRGRSRCLVRAAGPGPAWTSRPARWATRWHSTATRCEPDGDSSGPLTPVTAVRFRRSPADAHAGGCRRCSALRGAPPKTYARPAPPDGD